MKKQCKSCGKKSSQHPEYVESDTLFQNNMIETKMLLNLSNVEQMVFVNYVRMLLLSIKKTVSPFLKFIILSGYLRMGMIQ